MFGFFECEQDPEAAAALLAMAEQWLRVRGRDRMVGPMDITTNDECGVLIDGYDQLPTILTNWQHRYYPGLLEGAGLSKATDLYMWNLEVSDRSRVHPATWQVADDVEAKHGIAIRPMRKRDMEAEIRRFLEVYNAAWERNYNQGVDSPGRPVVAVRMGQGAVLPAQDQSRPRVRARRQAGVAARRDRGEVLRASLRLGRWGAESCAPIGSTRRSFEHDRARCHHVALMTDHIDVELESSEVALDEEEETVDGLPVLADVRPIERASAAVALPAVQAAAVAATGFVAGAATVALVRRHSARKLARAQRNAPRRPIDMLPVVGSRTFLVDVHLLGKSGE